MAKQHFQYAHVNHKGSMGNDGETTLEKGMYTGWFSSRERCLHHVGQTGSKSVGLDIT